MDKSFLVFMAIGIGAMYLLINFMGDIQKTDERFENADYNTEHKYDKYQATDSIGRDILDVSKASMEEQVDAWNNSLLKDEFTNDFPHFDDMKLFITDRIRGEYLVNELTQVLEDIEDKFFSGKITPEKAKKALGSLY